MPYRMLVRVALLFALLCTNARADDGGPQRSGPWQTATTATAIAAAASGVLMPRVFFSDPQTTAGWKYRWHISALAPTMTLTSLVLLNESTLKGAFGSYRPGCDQTNQGSGTCQDYGLFSSPAFIASAAVAQGIAVFAVDTIKWSDGRLHGGALAGDVFVPLAFAVVTGAGRVAGNWESGEQVAISSLVGVGFGAITGLTYALLARPECPFGSGLVCW